MLITHNIKLSRILINTWQVDLIMIVSCAVLIFRQLYQGYWERLLPSLLASTTTRLMTGGGKHVKSGGCL